MWVTPYYASLIDPDDPYDPILLQVLPGEEELACTGGPDPLAEDEHSPVSGLIHRYPDRALLTPTGFCPTLCRFCLRRRAWSGEPVQAGFNAGAVLDYIRYHEAIRDVIFSGGDPLLLPLELLEELLEGIAAIPHVRMVRIGSRTPATLPMRIDDEITALLGRFRPYWFLTHFNHPREVTDPAKQALERLRAGGACINNQSVLLRGVNDDADTLIELSARLLENGVKPYYLHQVDLVPGVDRFRVPIDEGMKIVEGMFGRISGLGIPRYTLDLPGGKGKVPLTPRFLVRRTDRTWVFRAPLGGEVEVPG
jgi:lysine 2,3-aminomutase